METKRLVVFTGHWSDESNEAAPPKPEKNDFVTCADIGYLICASAGYKPDVVIGDFDSLTEKQIAEIDALGIERIVYPSEKDETDTLLCVKHGLSLGFDDFLIVGGIGGEFSHTLANIQVLSFLADMDCKAEIITASERFIMVDGETLSVFREMKPAVPLTINGPRGKKFSVFSYAERSSGVYINNAKYELTDTILTQSYPVGTNNEFTEKETVTISVKYGRLLVCIKNAV